MAAMSSTAPVNEDIVYPESDGAPTADNTEQWNACDYLVNALKYQYRGRPDVFVAGDLFWYPVEGQPKIVIAPDALVALGRPRGRRGSYRQWDEGGVAPQVVFEVLSPSNSGREMLQKLGFYDRYKVSEYYVFDPDTGALFAWHRTGDHLAPVQGDGPFDCPVLGLVLHAEPSRIWFTTPDGTELPDYMALAEMVEAGQASIDTANAAADAAKAAAEAANAEVERLRERLRQLGGEA